MVLGKPTLIQLHQRPWLIQDDIRLIHNCINRLKTILGDTNFICDDFYHTTWNAYHKSKNGFNILASLKSSFYYFYIHILRFKKIQ